MHSQAGVLETVPITTENVHPTPQKLSASLEVVSNHLSSFLVQLHNYVFTIDEDTYFSALF